MKKVSIILLFALFAGFAAKTQIHPGSIAIGGHLFFNPLSIKSEYKDFAGDIVTDKGKLTLISIMPKGHFAIAKNMTVGAGIGYTHLGYKPDTDEDDKTTASIFNFNPLFRYYRTPLEHAGIFLEGCIGLGFGSATTESTIWNNQGQEELQVDKNGIFTMGFGVKPGFFIKLTDIVYFEATVGSLSYMMVNVKDKDDDIEGDDDDKAGLGNFNFSVNPGLTFGFAFYLNNTAQK